MREGGPGASQESLGRLVEGQVVAVRDSVTGLRRGLTDVHDARVALRRLRAWLARVASSDPASVDLVRTIRHAERVMLSRLERALPQAGRRLTRQLDQALRPSAVHLSRP